MTDILTKDFHPKIAPDALYVRRNMGFTALALNKEPFTAAAMGVYVHSIPSQNTTEVMST